MGLKGAWLNIKHGGREPSVEYRAVRYSSPEDTLHTPLYQCTLHSCNTQMLSSQKTCIAFKAFILQVCVSNPWLSNRKTLINNHKTILSISASHTLTKTNKNTTDLKKTDLNTAKGVLRHNGNKTQSKSQINIFSLCRCLIEVIFVIDPCPGLIACQWSWSTY